MVVQEAYALAQLADAIGREEGPMLKNRGDSLSKLIGEYLWDEESNICESVVCCYRCAWCVRGLLYGSLGDSLLYLIVCRREQICQRFILPAHLSDIVLCAADLCTERHSGHRNDRAVAVQQRPLLHCGGRRLQRPRRHLLLGSALDPGVRPSIPTARLLARLRLGTDGPAHLLVTAELRPCAGRPQRAESSRETDGFTNDVAMGELRWALRYFLARDLYDIVPHFDKECVMRRRILNWLTDWPMLPSA